MSRLGVFRFGGGFCLEQFAAGAHKIGWEVDLLGPGDLRRRKDYDLVVVAGAPWKYRNRNRRVCRNNRPWLILEVGWLYQPRKPSHFFTYLNKYPYCHPEWCPPDRREALNMTAEFRPRGDEILIVGQGRNDEALFETAAKLKTGRKIVYRPRRQVDHPRWVKKTDYEVDMTRTAVEALDQAFCVITHYSNMGGLALMRGIPVIGSPEATYAEMVYQNVRDVERLEPPSEIVVNEWLSRMAYTLWSGREFESGEAFGWLAEHCEELHG